MRVFCLNYHYSNYVFRINETNRRAYVPIRHMATAMVNAGGARGFGTAYALNMWPYAASRRSIIMLRCCFQKALKLAFLGWMYIVP